MPILIGYGLLAMGPGLPLPSPYPVLPHLSNFGREFVRRPACVQHEHIASKLVPKPGLLPLGVLPASDGDRFRHRVTRSLAMEIFDRFANADPVETWRIRGVTLGQHRRHLLDQTAADHILRSARDPLVQHRP